MSRLAAILLLVACGDDFPDDRAFGPEVPAGAPHTTVVHVPTTVGVVDTSRTDALGRSIGVACQTCHGGEAPLVKGDGPPEECHKKVDLQHGNLSCGACHDLDTPFRLHLADGTPLAMGEAKDLCAQCHGLQHRDWLHGAHGGMNGWWDLQRGPRVRNVCLDCHAAHHPAIGQVRPVLPPQDRGLPPREDHAQIGEAP